MPKMSKDTLEQDHRELRQISNISEYHKVQEQSEFHQMSEIYEDYMVQENSHV